MTNGTLTPTYLSIGSSSLLHQHKEDTGEASPGSGTIGLPLGWEGPGMFDLGNAHAVQQLEWECNWDFVGYFINNMSLGVSKLGYTKMG